MTQGQVQQIQSEFNQLQTQIPTLQRKKRGETVKVPIRKTAIVLIGGEGGLPCGRPPEPAGRGVFAGFGLGLGRSAGGALGSWNWGPGTGQVPRKVHAAAVEMHASGWGVGAPGPQQGPGFSARSRYRGHKAPGPRRSKRGIIPRTPNAPPLLLVHPFFQT